MHATTHFSQMHKCLHKFMNKCVTKPSRVPPNNACSQMFMLESACLTAIQAKPEGSKSASAAECRAAAQLASQLLDVPHMAATGVW
jgi:hypothetical protein